MQPYNQINKRTIKMHNKLMRGGGGGGGDGADEWRVGDTPRRRGAYTDRNSWDCGVRGLAIQEGESVSSRTSFSDSAAGMTDRLEGSTHPHPHPHPIFVFGAAREEERIEAAALLASLCRASLRFFLRGY